MNFDKQLQGILKDIKDSGVTPHLLVHSCCAPCSTYVLEYLSPYFNISVYYYNPNITPKKEYEQRLLEVKHFVKNFNSPNSIVLIESEYNPKVFFLSVKGLEKEPEGGARCTECFKLRLSEAAKKAQEIGADYFVSTLTISPMKNAPLLNQIAEECSAIYKIQNLVSDFKKQNGYKRSVELSKEFDLYRQDYCGCVFSKYEKKFMDKK